MFHWLREYLELRYEFRERQRVCQSCETLKQVNDHLRMDNEKLLRRILEKPEPETATQAPEITKPRFIPWAVKRQMLEREDRERAKLLASAPKPQTTEELEKELDIASAERESQNATKS